MPKSLDLANKAQGNIGELIEVLENEVKKPTKKAQTLATEKWNEKRGLVTKSFKLNGEIASKFLEAVNAAGDKQGEVIEGFMQAYIDGLTVRKPCFFCRFFSKN